MSVLYYLKAENFFSTGNETGRSVRLMGELQLWKEGTALKEAEYAQRATAEKERLYRTALLYLGGEAAALDAVDEAVYRGLLACGRLRRPEFFSTWLTRILLNTCADELRRRRREIAFAQPPETAAPDYDALPLRDAVARLPQELRAVVVLRYFSGYTLAETAEILSLPAGTASTRQRKALALLRLELCEEV